MHYGWGLTKQRGQRIITPHGKIYRSSKFRHCSLLSFIAVLHCCHLNVHHENTQISQPVAIAGLPGVYCLDPALPEKAMVVAPQMVWHTNPTGARDRVPPTTSDDLGW